LSRPDPISARAHLGTGPRLSADAAQASAASVTRKSSIPFLYCLPSITLTWPAPLQACPKSVIARVSEGPLTLHVIAFADGILAGTRPVSTATLDLYYLGWLGQMWTNPAATVLT
jgi:hypothetical protein